MKPNKQLIYQWITVLIGFAVSIAVLMSIASCSDSKQAQKGYDKFIKHGGKLNPEYIYTERIDSVIINGKTEYITVIDSVKVDCPDQPKTRYEVRNERKSKEDSLKHALKTLKEKNAFTIDSLNKVIRLAKIQKKVHKIDSKQAIKEIIHKTKQIRIQEVNFKWYHYILLVVAFLLGAYLRGLIASLFYVIKK